MNDRKHILTTAAIVMVCLAAVVTAAGTAITYRSALTEKQTELSAVALREARVIESIFGYKSTGHSPSDHTDFASASNCSNCGEKIAIVMHMLRESGSFESAWGQGVEFVVGRRESNSIRFLLRSHHIEQDDINGAMEIPWQSQLAEPMRLALSGLSGIIEAEDYCGETVLAAYAPIKILGWGVVAKIDKAELYAPFIGSVRNSLLIAVFAILIGLIVLQKRLNPMVQRLQNSERQAHKALAELNNQKQAMDEHSIIATTDPSGKITYVNDKFCQISKYPREELLGQDHRILNSGHHPRSFFVDMWHTISSGQAWHGEICNRAKDGSLYWVLTTITPFKDRKGRITQYIAIRTDTTERTRTEKELRQAKVAAEAADRAKGDFLANMSHEIRTPMTAIIGFAENLLDFKQADTQMLSHIHTIRRNGEHLLNLINDILDLSKIDAGKMTVERIDYQLCQVIAEVASLMRVRADAKGLQLNIEYDGAIPETIHSDPTRLRQILINLIGNAVKFTETGTVRLVTRFVSDGVEPVMQFDVTDSGCGMTEAQKAKLFQPFTQADASTTRKFGGTGLGLTISERFAKLLSGKIIVATTNMGVGTTFRATVATGPIEGSTWLDNPMLETVQANPGKTDTTVSPTDLQGLRILLAEDGPDNQRLISYILKKAGADVTVEENGKLALGKALAAMNHRRKGDPEPFDIILMDMQMPVMDGYDATSQLRQRGYTGPIIALTAHAMASDRQKCIDAGCDDYATKPVDRKKLIETIQTHSFKLTTIHA